MRNKILVLGCVLPSSIYSAIQHEEAINKVFELIKNEAQNIEILCPDLDDIEKFLEFKEKDPKELIQILIDEKEYIKIHEELPKQPIIHGYQNPRNTIMLSSRRKFSRKCYKKRKKR